MHAPPLADLHLHFYGNIRAEDFLGYVAGRDVDWSTFEDAYQQAFGEFPQIRDVLRRHRE